MALEKPRNCVSGCCYWLTLSELLVGGTAVRAVGGTPPDAVVLQN